MSSNFANPPSHRSNQSGLSWTKATDSKIFTSTTTAFGGSNNSLWQAYCFPRGFSPFREAGQDSENTNLKRLKSLLIKSLLSCLTEYVRSQIQGYSTATAIWNSLKRVFADTAMTQIIDYKNTLSNDEETIVKPHQEKKWQSLRQVLLVGIYAGLTEGMKSWVMNKSIPSALWTGLERSLVIWYDLNQTSQTPHQDQPIDEGQTSNPQTSTIPEMNSSRCNCGRENQSRRRRNRIRNKQLNRRNQTQNGRMGRSNYKDDHVSYPNDQVMTLLLSHDFPSKLKGKRTRVVDDCFPEKAKMKKTRYNSNAQHGRIWLRHPHLNTPNNPLVVLPHIAPRLTMLNVIQTILLIKIVAKK